MEAWLTKSKTTRFHDFVWPNVKPAYGLFALVLMFHKLTFYGLFCNFFAYVAEVVILADVAHGCNLKLTSRLPSVVDLAKATLQFPYGELSLEEFVDQKEEGELAALRSDPYFQFCYQRHHQQQHKPQQPQRLPKREAEARLKGLQFENGKPFARTSGPLLIDPPVGDIRTTVGGIVNAAEDWYVGPLPEVHCSGSCHSHRSGGGCYGSGTQRRRVTSMEKEGQERFVTEIVVAISELRVTHCICTTCVSYWSEVLGSNIAHTYTITFIEAGNQNMVLACMGDEMGLNWVSLVVEMGHAIYGEVESGTPTKYPRTMARCAMIYVWCIEFRGAHCIYTNLNEWVSSDVVVMTFACTSLGGTEFVSNTVFHLYFTSLLRENMFVFSEKIKENVRYSIGQKVVEIVTVFVKQVMGRSSPNDKLLLVQALRKKGHVVAVPGDGTNDSPALHEGKSVYANIQKFIQFQLIVNVVALVINVAAAIDDGDVPLNAMQLLWVNLIMDTLGALALATEPNPCNNYMWFFLENWTNRVSQHKH
ncbi:Cation-transporting P-type ATPase [Artemisia annua]|uniref:Cation-transporting P-type ATPase n=1 Tax=Artemisia annua TaxID=35608 RepID=A0A2U1LJD0_ARTAN|nr:Cation-transporting P-type ATPase [Artemisia annua]